MKRQDYEKKLHKLQIELTHLQTWLRESGERAIVVFEGRDSAGKGSMIRTITERLNKRVFNSVALPQPSDREQKQWYPQRYIKHFPAAGEISLFDRSWYNRAGVERVMGFCTAEQTEHFLAECPSFEQAIVNSGTKLIKYWLDIDPEIQLERLQERQDDPRKHWKLSPMDYESRKRWYQYSLARDEMLKRTDTDAAPWFVVPSNDQRKARLNCISHLLGQFPYQVEPFSAEELPEVDRQDAYDDKASMLGRRFVAEGY
jgi:polyphosphate kinase 2